MHIDDALQKHLPTKLAETFKSAVSDRSVFLQGVNYEYEGKTWNIRLAVDEEKGLFIRTNSLQALFGDYYTGQIRKSPDGKHQVEIYQKKLQYMDRSKSGSGSDGKGTWPIKYKHDFFEDKTYEILTKGTKVSDVKAPKTITTIVDYVKDFFTSCPDLLPEASPELPNVTVAPSTPTEGTSSSKSHLIFKVIIGLAAVYLLYKVAGYVSSIWKESSQTTFEVV